MLHSQSSIIIGNHHSSLRIIIYYLKTSVVIVKHQSSITAVIYHLQSSFIILHCPMRFPIMICQSLTSNIAICHHLSFSTMIQHFQSLYMTAKYYPSFLTIIHHYESCSGTLYHVLLSSVIFRWRESVHREDSGLGHGEINWFRVQTTINHFPERSLMQLPQAPWILAVFHSIGTSKRLLTPR